MKTRTFLLAALALALLPVSARQSLPDSSTPAWIQEFNNLPETTRKSYIAQFRKAEQLFAQKRIMECLFSLMELEKLYAGNPGLYNLRGACYIEIRNIEKALENFEKAQKLDPSNLTIQFNLAEAHYVNHDYSRALKAFTELGVFSQCLQRLVSGTERGMSGCRTAISGTKTRPAKSYDQSPDRSCRHPIGFG